MISGNNNIDVSQLMKMLSNMDKSRLEEGLAKASKILNSKEGSSLMEEIKKKH